MPASDFDDRYPAMFQPGGEDSPDASFAVDGREPAASSNQEQPAAQDPAAQGAVAGAPRAEEFTERPDQGAQPSAWPPHLWIVAIAAAVVMIAGGVFALTAQYWLPWSRDIEPADFSGIELQPWGQIIFGASPPLIGVGMGILAALLFLAARRSAARESALRRAFAVLTVAVGVAGWTAIFATVIFPAAEAAWQADYNNRPALPWTYVVSFTGVWLFSLALLMLAALVVAPRRWQQPQGEPGELAVASDLGDVSALRGLYFGAAAATAGMFVLFTPYIFPLATGMVVATLPDGTQTTHPGWVVTAQNLLTPLLLTGFLVLAWSLVTLAVTPKNSPVAGREAKKTDGVDL